MSVYDLSEEQLGRFDVVFFFGTLYHLRHPSLALDFISALCDGDFFVESAILDDFSPYRGGIGQDYSDDRMVMEYYLGEEYGDNMTNWWVPTLQCLLNMVMSAGFFNNAGAWKLAPNPSGLPYCCGFVHAAKP